MGPIRMLAMLLGLQRGVDWSGLPTGSIVQRDVAYGPDPAQCIDIYLPPRGPGGPIIVLVHGGAWTTGDKAAPAVVENKVAHWLPLGVVVASVNYRLLPLADPLEQARDVARALAFLQERFQVSSPEEPRFVLIGHSTGAHLSALLAADPDLAAREGAKSWRATVLIESGALDVVRMMQGPRTYFHDQAFGLDPEGWQRASPLHRLHGKPAPVLLVYSTMRRDSAAQAQAFADAVVARGGRAEMLPIAMSHSAVNAQLGEDHEYTTQVDAFLRSVGCLGAAGLRSL